MKKLVFATGNKSKVNRFHDKLMKNDIELVSIKDVGLTLEAEENGKDVIENAIIKATECYEKTGLPSMGMDDSLYLEGVPEELQPGLFVRRINGRELEDEEMIIHYIEMVNKYGKDGKLDGKWVYGLCVINEDGEKSTYTWTKEDFYLTNEISDVFNERYPLNSISKYKKIDKYFTDVTEEDRELLKADESDVIDFITNSMNVELWDIYDKNGNKLDIVKPRGKNLTDDEYHLVVNSWIRNSKGEYLISQRNEQKKHPLMWECSGGSVLRNETTNQAAIREIKEELGIDISDAEPILIGRTIRYFKGCPDILDILLFNYDIDINKVKIQKEEVKDAKWATKEEIIKLREEGKFLTNEFFDEAINYEPSIVVERTR